MDELNRQFGIGERLRFERHSSGLVQGVVQTNKCQGSFFLLGGHVAEYWPSSQGHPLLFMSKEAVYEVGKPIRGGVPICFPWFGANKMDSTAPAHGLVRTALWNVLSANETAAGIAVTLGYASPPYRLQLTVVYGERLDLNLTVINESDVDQVCEIALHTYLQLGAAREAVVTGLERHEFRNQLDGSVHAPTGEPIRFTEETDRVYRGSVTEVTVADPVNGRRLRIVPRHSLSTVVWNPWVAKSKRMPDFGDDEFETMCCIETANVAPNNWILAAGGSQEIGFELSALPS